MAQRDRIRERRALSSIIMDCGERATDELGIDMSNFATACLEAAITAAMRDSAGDARRVADWLIVNAILHDAHPFEVKGDVMALRRASGFDQRKDH
jgi:hypothetical protein